MDDYMFNYYVSKCKYLHEDTRYVEIFNYSVSRQLLSSDQLT